MSTYKSWLEKTKKQINKTYDAQKKQTEDVYNRAINQTSSDAESSYRQNEVDRIFNEKKIAEVNANLGLTNSGLNRTQQTAVQLSHSNRDYEISKARQDAIDNIALEKAGKITEIENNRQNDLYEAKESYDSAVSSVKNTTSSDNTTTTNNVYWHNDGEDENNTNKLIFSDGNGNTKSIAKGINPYTGKRVYDYGYGTWNGYQPKGVWEHGQFLFDQVDETTGPIVNGHRKRVHKTADGKQWIWDDYLNNIGGYVEVEYILNNKTGKYEWMKVK